MNNSINKTVGNYKKSQTNNTSNIAKAIIRKPQYVNAGQVRSMINSLKASEEEVKVYTTGDATVAITADGLLIPLSNVPQGQSDSQRIGDSCKWKEFDIRATLRCATSDVTNEVRLVLFQWKPNNTPSVNSLSYSTLSSLGYLNAVNFPYSKDNYMNFKVLVDQRYSLNVYQTPTLNFHWNVRDLLKQVQFVNGSASIGNNLIYLLCISDSAVVPAPFLDYNTRLSYTDS